MTSIYALLIGINEYPLKPLQGCINDVNAVEKYLHATYDHKTDTTLYILRLTDVDESKPTRENFIKAFAFFKPAGKGDVCLFYYSGHGSYAPAPKAFWTATNGYNQSFVCADSRTAGGRDLIDKEMAYLLWETFAEKKETDCIVITDCCHSGTITKALQDNSGVQDRMIGANDHIPADLADYYGFDHYEHSKDPVTGEERLTVNQVAHLHLGAAEDLQTSKELDIDGEVRGAFTHSLLKALYVSGGNLSYGELLKRASIYVRNLVSNQDPILNINGQLPAAAADKYFLSDQNAVTDPLYTVSFHSKYGWNIPGGTIHGISKGDVVFIEELNYTTKVIAVPAPDRAQIPGNIIFGGNNDKTYRATVSRQPNQQLHLGFARDIDAGVQALIQTAYDKKENDFVFIGPENKGRYIIRTEEKRAYLTIPGTTDPVFASIYIKDIADAADFLKKAGVMGRWQHLLELNNPSAVMNDKHFEVRLYCKAAADNYDKKEFVEVTDLSAAKLFYQQAGEEWYQPAIEVRVTNKSTQPLWVSCAYMGFDYAIDTGFFQLMSVAPGGTSSLTFINDQGLPDDVVWVMLDEKYRELGYTAIREYLKVFISTQRMDIASLQQDGVELMRSKSTTPRMVTKGLGKDTRADLPATDWKTVTIGMDVIRPQDAQQINPTGTLDLNGVTITNASGMEAKVRMISSAALGSIGTKGFTGLVPPGAVNGNQFLQPFDMLPSSRQGNVADVIELIDVKGAENVTEVSPLRISLNDAKPAADETIIPMGYDKQSGLYFPLGYTDHENNIVIQVLPEATASAESITQKSFIGSIKIFLQKVVGSKLGFEYKYPQLAIPSVTAEGKVAYNTDIIEIKKRVTAAGSILLLIHGIIGDTTGMVQSAKTTLDNGKTLNSSFDLVLTFDYESLNTRISENAALLKNKLAAVGLGEEHDKSLIIAAHSMGGLISRWFIEQLGGHQTVRKLIMFGTPNSGSQWVSVSDMAQALLTFAVNGSVMLKPWTLLLSGIGKLMNGIMVAFDEMSTDPEKGICGKLNNGKDPGIPYVIVAGNTRDIIVKYDATAGLIERMFKQLKGRGVYDALDALVFKMPNDIAVTDVNITTLGDTHNWKFQPEHHELACDHLNYFMLTEALDRITLPVVISQTVAG